MRPLITIKCRKVSQKFIGGSGVRKSYASASSSSSSPEAITGARATVSSSETNNYYDYSVKRCDILPDKENEKQNWKQ